MSPAPGVMGPTAERLALAERVRGLRSQGFSHREVGQRLGISRSYASELVIDPDGSKSRARKDSYGGACGECGAATTGSDGPGLAPELCAGCSRQRQHDERHWTAEVVIDAIQRYASIHGRPPTADEWVTSDPANDYPPRSAVYRGRGNHNPSAPFELWADAIEAAGFPRPTSGRRTWRETMQNRTGYVVLRENAEGTWEVVGEREEASQVLALNAALNGHKPEGRWLAVPMRYWRPRALTPRTIFDFVEEPAEA